MTGGGNKTFTIYVDPKFTKLYATIETYKCSNPKQLVVVKEKDLIKRESVKTTDYTFNSYIATWSKEQDGYLGVFTDE